MTSVEELGRADSAEEREKRTSYLELFFDLVFVFAITQVTALILSDTSWQGFLRSALVLGLLWWAWGGYTWMTNAIDIGSLAVRVGFVAAMTGSFFMALAVPDAYGDDGLWFAIPYFLVRVLHVTLYAYGLRAEPAHRAAVLHGAPYFLLAPAVVVVGAFFDGDVRVLLWTVSIVVDVGGVLTLGTAGFRVSPSHFAERYGLFVIIALGESIVAIGVGASQLEHDRVFAAAVVVTFAGVATLWWSYFDVPARGAERTLAATPVEKRAPMARDVFSILHYPFVLGLILYAVGAKKTLEHPDEPLTAAGRWALGLGIAASLVGMAAARFRAVRRVAWERLVGAAMAALAAAALTDLDALWLAAFVVAILAAALLAEAARLREFRAGLRPA